MNQWIDWHQSFLSFYSNQLIEHHHDWHCQDDPTNWLDYFRPFYSNLLNQIKFTSSKFFGVHDITQPLLYSYWILFITLHISISVGEKYVYIKRTWKFIAQTLDIPITKIWETLFFIFFVIVTRYIHTGFTFIYIHIDR